MGYTHNWWRNRDIEATAFAAIMRDFALVAKHLQDHGLPLTSGAGVPRITPLCIQFNGLADCGHAKKELHIAWPTDGARGVAGVGDARSGAWHAGDLVKSRTCNGDCSFEDFSFPRRLPRSECLHPDRRGRHRQFCKTAFRPYDIAVTAVLLVAKHRLGDLLDVGTDGDDTQWRDARDLCQAVLGYGETYYVEDGKLRVEAIEEPGTRSQAEEPVLP